MNFARLRELLSPNSRILDLGCGYGRVLGLMREIGYHNLIGFDPAPAMVAAARARFPAITFEEENMANLPLADASVDATPFVQRPDLRADRRWPTIVKEVGRALP